MLKKLTKKEIQAKMSDIIMRMAMKQEVSDEEKTFFEQQSSGVIV